VEERRLSARRLFLTLIAALALAGAGAAPASASATAKVLTVTKTVTVAAGSPVLVSNLNQRPPGYSLTGRQAEGIAARDPVVIKALKQHPGAYPGVYTKGGGQWQVSWWNRAATKELIQVYVDDATRKVTEAWTGFQVAWTMARGYPGAFGHNLNHPWIWLPLCALFIAPFIPLPRRRARHRASPESACGKSSGFRHRGGRWCWPGWSLLHLDLVMLVGFSISLAYFNNANLGLSVPLAYPFLIYLLVRMLLLGFGRGRPRVPLRINVSVYVLIVVMSALIGFRVYSNIKDSGVIDVGYAGVIGADRIIHGEKLYGVWPVSNPTGDTYGPVNYYAYVPFRAVFGWSGSWDSLPAGHAAAIAFDLLTMVALFLLGRQVRGPTLGVTLSYAWAAYPFTFYVLQSSSNDSLLALLIVLALLTFTSRPARGVFLSLATFAKFFPAALGPLFLRGTEPLSLRGPARATWGRRVLAFCVPFALAGFAVMAQVIFQHDFVRFWDDTIVRQWSRVSPFSVWNELWGNLSFPQHIVEGMAVALAVVVAIFPRRRRTLVEVAALAAAVTIAFQLSLTHWFYLYIVWFFPPVMVALLGCEDRASNTKPAGAESSDADRSDEQLLVA
jgi:hypothetical protein